MDYKSRIADVLKRGIEHQTIIVTILILLLTFFLGMGIGLLIQQPESNPIIIDKNVKVGLPAQTGLPLASDKIIQQTYFTGSNFVASINGKAYYPKDCKAANVIKEENRIWFESAKEAEEEGYARAKNCP